MKNDIKPFFDSALRYVVDNYKKCKKNKSFSNNDNKKQNLDEIEQILLYLTIKRYAIFCSPKNWRKKGKRCTRIFIKVSLIAAKIKQCLHCS